nr:WAS/WASL-interacting protein family member 2-like [Aegilops tauschii subsp. strangulata]
MAPKKKKSGPSAQPSTSDAVGYAGTGEDVSAAGGVAGTGGAITTPPAVDTGAKGVGGEQLQQRFDGQAPQGADGRVTPLAPPPPTCGGSHSNGARSGVSHRPPASLLRGRSRHVRLLPGAPTQPPQLMEPQTLERHHHATLLPRWPPHRSAGAPPPPPPRAPSGAKRRCS